MELECPFCHFDEVEIDTKQRWNHEMTCPNCKNNLKVDYDFYTTEEDGFLVENDLYELNEKDNRANVSTYKGLPLNELLTSEFDIDQNDENSWLNRNIRGYGLDENGEVLKFPDGYRLLNLGEYVPQKHAIYSKTSAGDGIWLFKNCRSTMTPIIAMINGSDLAFAVKIEDAS